MTIMGILLLDVVGLVLMIWVLNLIRRGRLYVGYGAIMFISIVGIIVIVSIPPLQWLMVTLLEWVFKTNAFLILVFGYLFMMLIYVLTQVSLLSDRLAAVVQDMAIRETAVRSLKNSPVEENISKIGT